jgi:hypothetical protein
LTFFSRFFLVVEHFEFDLVSIQDRENAVDNHNLVVKHAFHGNCHNHDYVNYAEGEKTQADLDKVKETLFIVVAPKVLVFNPLSNLLGFYRDDKV